MEKDEGTGFTSWQKADCASVFSVEMYGIFLTIICYNWAVACAFSQASPAEEAKVLAGGSNGRQH